MVFVTDAKSMEVYLADSRCFDAMVLQEIHVTSALIEEGPGGKRERLLTPVDAANGIMRWRVP